MKAFRRFVAAYLAFLDRDTVGDAVHIGGIAALAFMAGALLGAPLLVMAVLP